MAICALATTVHGASGTWTNRNGGGWTTALNWNASVIADGSGSTANFSTLNLPADVTVTLGAARTIGSLTFDDLNAIKHNWILNPGGNFALTLAGGTPFFAVSNATTTLNLPLAGTAGFTKAGTGRLTLTASNSYSGTTTVSAGTLGFAIATLSSASPLVISPASAVAESSGALNLIVNSSGPTTETSGSGILKLTSTTNGPTAPDIYFGPITAVTVFGEHA